MMKSTHIADRPEAAIARCVAVCADARDGRGRWRAERECAQALLDGGTSGTVASMTSAAAAGLGAWIAERSVALSRHLQGAAMT